MNRYIRAHLLTLTGMGIIAGLAWLSVRYPTAFDIAFGVVFYFAVVSLIAGVLNDD
jgi:hypothetical protein